MSKGLRKIARIGAVIVDHKRKAQSGFWQWGERAVQMAVVCRRSGLRDLVIPVGDVAECVPKLADRVKVRAPTCMVSAWGRASCNERSVLCTITDSGFVGFFCEKHAEERVVRL